MTRFFPYCVLFIAFLLLSFRASAAGVVIANTSVADDAMSRNHLLSIFTMRASQWPGGDTVTLVVYPDEHPSHVSFVKDTLRLFPYQLRNIWDRYIFSGAAQAPLEVSSPGEMIEQVRRVSGAIGYLKSGADAVEGVRIIEIY